MLVFFVIPAGSRTTFTPLVSLRRSKILTKSRAWREHVKRFRRNSKWRKTVRDLGRIRSLLLLINADESGTDESGIDESGTEQSGSGILEIRQELDGGMGKPHEQITLEWWLWKMKKEPRHFSRNP